MPFLQTANRVLGSPSHCRLHAGSGVTCCRARDTQMGKAEGGERDDGGEKPGADLSAVVIGTPLNCDGQGPEELGTASDRH